MLWWGARGWSPGLFRRVLLVRLFGLWWPVSGPVAVDNEHKLKDAFQNDQGFVPAYYLFDAEGKLRSFAAGERGLDMLKTALDRITG